MQAFEKAESGYTQLVEEEYHERETETAEALLDAWKADLQAQNQRANGQFAEAIRTTNDAISGFRIANADGPAQTAQARQYQLQAVQAQLELEFDKAADHHQKARKQTTSTPTERVHSVEAKLCVVKNHLLEGEVEQARETLRNCDREEQCITNLGVLIDVYADYTSDELTPINAMLEQLDTSQADRGQDGRHISYHGDYISAIIHVVAAQRLSQQNIPPAVLNHITQAAIKNAISGGSSYEWTEISELSHVDAETTWRLRIPAVIQSDLEYVEYNAKKGSFPNYAASGMKLLAALEGYLRVLVEYYAKREYGAQWQDEVIARANLTLGDIYTFFASDAAADRISVRAEICAELDDLRYFDAESNISEVRNDLDHDNLSWLDEQHFTEIKDHVFEIMRRSAFDCPIIAEIENVTETHEIYFVATRLKWNRVPRRPEISTTANIEDSHAVYLPPDPAFDSGMVEVPAEELEVCELDPKRVAKPERE